MTIKEFYENIGGNYNDVMGRLMKEERIAKYLKRLPDDGSMVELCRALDAEDWETAFRMAHTMKGVAANLGLDEMAKASSVLCEALRPGVKPEGDADAMLEKVRTHYDAAIAAIKELEKLE